MYPQWGGVPDESGAIVRVPKRHGTFGDRPDRERFLQTVEQTLPGRGFKQYTIGATPA
jgi:hypothetical protein